MGWHQAGVWKLHYQVTCYRHVDYSTLSQIQHNTQNTTWQHYQCTSNIDHSAYRYTEHQHTPVITCVIYYSHFPHLLLPTTALKTLAKCLAGEIPPSCQLDLNLVTNAFIVTWIWKTIFKILAFPLEAHVHACTHTLMQVPCHCT